MNINCIICSDQLISTSDIYATSCGHIFHYHCLIKWVENARSCPQCRTRTTEKTMHRIYFNLANTDGIVDDAATLHFKLNNLQSQLKLKNKDIEIYNEKCGNAKAQTEELKSMRDDLENETKASDFVIETLKGQLAYFKTKSTESDYLCEEISNLKIKLKEFDGIMSILNESKEQANDMLTHNRDSNSLSILVATLRKELIGANKKCKQAAADLKTANNSLCCYKKKLLEIQQENNKLKLDADVHKNCANEQEYLRQKLSDLETSSIKLLCTPKTHDERIIFIEDEDSNAFPKRRHITKDLSIIDLTKVITPSSENHTKKVAAAKPCVGEIKLLGGVNKEYYDSLAPLNEFGKRKPSSTISKAKFKKLAPNKKLRGHLLNIDE